MNDKGTSTGTTNPDKGAMYDATRKRRKNTRRKRGMPEIGELNITPMLDMMTILLVFLLMNYATSSSDINVANLVLPHSSTTLKVEEALQLIVTENVIMLDRKVVVDLTDTKQVAGEDLEGGESGYLILPLYDALESHAAHLKQIDEYGGSQFLGRIAVIADKTLPYSVIFKVLYTCGRAEFGSFKLFVQRAA